jgi:hypothetical protein
MESRAEANYSAFEAADRGGLSRRFFIAVGLRRRQLVDLICERHPAVRHAGVYGPQFLAGSRSSMISAVLRSLSTFCCFNHKGTLTTLLNQAPSAPGTACPSPTSGVCPKLHSFASLISRPEFTSSSQE